MTFAPCVRRVASSPTGRSDLATDVAPVEPGPLEPTSEGGGAASVAPHRLVGSLSQILGSHLLVGVVGLVSLPVLARNFGPEVYGGFGLFTTLLGVVSFQDFLRPLLIREYSRECAPSERTELDALARVLPGILGIAAAAAGLAFLDLLPALAFAGAVFLHFASARDYAALAVAGRVGLASAVRNVGWAAAVVLLTALSFWTPGAHAYAWPFLAANLAIFLSYRALARRSTHVAHAISPLAGGGLASPWRPARAAWSRHRRDMKDLLGFNVACAVAVSADRVILDRSIGGAAFGRYVATADLALKLDVLGTALGTVLYPSLSRRVQSEGVEASARAFVRTAGWILVGHFLLLLALALVAGDVVRLVLGRDFAGSPAIFGLMLSGVFVHMLGFLITPWQRARGDFATQRRAYYASAAAALVTGLALIPTLGAAGALLAYLASRVAEVLLLASEVRTLPRSVLPIWKLLALAGMLGVLAWVGVARAGGAV